MAQVRTNSPGTAGPGWTWRGKRLASTAVPILRPALSDDARRLAALAERCFRHTYGAYNTPEDMKLYCTTTYTEAVQARELAAPDRLTFVSEDAGNLVGFAQLRWIAALGCVPAGSPGEIQRLYVASEWHGKGVAHPLMQACLEGLKARGSTVAWLGVWEKNPRAVSFYRKFGFTEVGEQIFRLGHDLQRDIVMARSLSDSRSGV